MSSALILEALLLMVLLLHLWKVGESYLTFDNEGYNDLFQNKRGFWLPLYPYCPWELLPARPLLLLEA